MSNTGWIVLEYRTHSGTCMALHRAWEVQGKQHGVTALLQMARRYAIRAAKYGGEGRRFELQEPGKWLHVRCDVKPGEEVRTTIWLPVTKEGHIV